MNQPWDFARTIDGLIEPFAPSLVRRRLAERMALKEIRQYDVAANGRRTQGWRRPSTSAARETQQGLVKARDSASELVRNNKYAASALRQMTANVVGDGITARAVHDDEGVAQRAQDAWDRKAESRMDGRHDHYGQQKLIFRSMAERGDSLAIWGPDDDGPDGVCRILEGDFLDHTKNQDSQATPIVQGVQFNRDGFREAYWLLNQHPGDARGFSRQSKPYAAANIDHVYEELRPGQPRGISWFAAVAMNLRDIADYEEAILMKRKVEACLALILTPAADGGPTNPFDAEAGAPAGPTPGADPAAAPSKMPDKMRPGMVMRARPGETATAINPSSSGDGIDFVRQQIMAICANLAPYHLVSGDPSQANYSQTRALMLGYWANLDDWQWNVMVPLFCQPAFERQMRRLALQTGDRRFLQVKPSFAMPVRRFIDPLKDVAGLTAELRLGTDSYPRILAQRGINWKTHLAEIAEFNKVADELKLVLDGDPRRATQSGVLQAAAGYLSSRTAQDE